MTSSTLCAWHTNYWNVVALCRWLAEEHCFGTQDLLHVMDKPWKWTGEWGEFQAEIAEKTVEQS